ncbi:MAG: lipoyl synthase [Flavobacteriales bacterium]|nr:lipoyl synthase [Flavobacteriales bacterium]|tara:strand:+ start:2116 stop:3048 length:933 start_codon:yes stop_codon:yes gene_type:complete
MSNQSIEKSPKWLKIKPANSNNNEQIISSNNVQKKPKWLRVKLPTGENYKHVRKLVSDNKLHTICESGNCPNMGECWGEGTATFMILGNICTRSCGFCSVATGRPLPVDWEEPEKVAESVRLMEVKHCVITSVDRDELPDGGSLVWVETVNAVRRKSPGTTMETLIPDFKGIKEQVQRIIDVAPEIVSHNIETVRRLTKEVRIQAKYDRSLAVLKQLKDGGMRTKSGIMLGLGETQEEVIQTMDDLRAVGVDIMTIGQYLQPTPKHLPVKEFINPKQFEKYKRIGLQKGFRFVESSPLVRSSYRAEKHMA